MKLSILRHRHYLLLCIGLLSLTVNVFAAGARNAFNANGDDCWQQLQSLRAIHPVDVEFLGAVDIQFPQNPKVLRIAKVLCHPQDQAPMPQQPVQSPGQRRYDVKEQEEKQLDPKRKGADFTNHEHGRASTLLQEANGGPGTYEERAMRVLTKIFSKERARALYDNILNPDDY